MIIPLSRTMTLSAFAAVDKRCAIIKVVLSLETLSKFFCISFSVLLSSADVASSKKNIFGFFKIVLAIATLCFSPPDYFNPLSPTIVS